MSLHKAYHGSVSGNFDEFKVMEFRCTENETNSLGFWFTNSKRVATQFALRLMTVYHKENGESSEEKLYFNKEWAIGGVHEVNLNLKNPKIYEVDNSNKETLLTELKVLSDEYEELLTCLMLEVDLAKRNAYARRVCLIEIQMEELNEKIKMDSFEIFMDDRDKFCCYINARKGEGSWRDRFVLLNKEEANTEYVNHLKSNGYDGIWIKSTLYDSFDGQTPLDQYVVFDSSLIQKLSYTTLTDIVDEKEIEKLKKKREPNHLF